MMGKTHRAERTALKRTLRALTYNEVPTRGLGINGLRERVCSAGELVRDNPWVETIDEEKMLVIDDEFKADFNAGINGLSNANPFYAGLRKLLMEGSVRLG